MLQNFLVGYGYQILIVLGLLILTLLFANLVHKASLRIFARSKIVDETAAPIVAQVIRLTVFIVVGLIILEHYGVDVTALIAALGIFAFAIAIGLRPTTTNFFSGIMLLGVKPYEVGDYIEGERVAGVVDALHIFHTEITTPEGDYVCVPNSAMWARSIRNYSRPGPVRVELDIVVERQLSFSEVKKVIDSSLRAESERKANIDPLIVVAASLQSSMTIRAAIWCDLENSWEVRQRVTDKLRVDITAAGATVKKIGAPRKTRPKKKTVSPPSGGDDL